jgi:metal-responsive CopG/Arc/MetJ family transcriptional regulator
MVRTVAKDNRVKPNSWGESKQRVQIMLTPTALERVDEMAGKMELTRAEIIERLIRSDCLDLKALRTIEGVDE